MRGYSLTSILLAVAGVIVAAGGGAMVTQLGSWYYGLRKPAWQPPDWLFGPAWTTIFVAMAVAFVLAWARTTSNAERWQLFGVYALNTVFNALWSALFFRLRRPDWALLEIAPFYVSILLVFFTVRSLRPGAEWLIAPYLLWVAFATVLNREIIRLNGPFTTR
jgi:translocator protein